MVNLYILNLKQCFLLARVKEILESKENHRSSDFDFSYHGSISRSQLYSKYLPITSKIAKDQPFYINSVDEYLGSITSCYIVNISDELIYFHYRNLIKKLLKKLIILDNINKAFFFKVNSTKFIPSYDDFSYDNYPIDQFLCQLVKLYSNSPLALNLPSYPNSKIHDSIVKILTSANNLLYLKLGLYGKYHGHYSIYDYLENLKHPTRLELNGYGIPDFLVLPWNIKNSRIELRLYSSIKEGRTRVINGAEEETKRFIKYLRELKIEQYQEQSLDLINDANYETNFYRIISRELYPQTSVEESPPFPRFFDCDILIDKYKNLKKLVKALINLGHLGLSLKVSVGFFKKIVKKLPQFVLGKYSYLLSQSTTNFYIEFHEADTVFDKRTYSSSIYRRKDKIKLLVDRQILDTKFTKHLIKTIIIILNSPTISKFTLHLSGYQDNTRRNDYKIKHDLLNFFTQLRTKYQLNKKLILNLRGSECGAELRSDYRFYGLDNQSHHPYQEIFEKYNHYPPIIIKYDSLSSSLKELTNNNRNLISLPTYQFF